MMTCFLFASAFSCTSLDDTDNGTDSSITDDEGKDDGGNEDEPDVPATPDPDIDSEQQGSGVPEGYTLVWEDLFDDGVLDPAKWLVEVNGDGGGNSEMQFYRAENITEGTDPAGNGSLIITARKEDYNGKLFTSGRLNTSDRFEFTHGKVEASIMLPQTANGLWPAFWLLGADYDINSWPRCGEIDILEMGHANGIANGTQDRYFNGAAHWGYYIGSSYPNYAKNNISEYSLQDGQYHLFTLFWNESSLKMYLDLDKNPQAAPYYEMNINTTNDQWGGTQPYFHHDFFIIFNLAVGGNFPGIHNASLITALPEDGSEARMYVNYVKVYQKK